MSNNDFFNCAGINNPIYQHANEWSEVTKGFSDEGIYYTIMEWDPLERQKAFVALCKALVSMGKVIEERPVLELICNELRMDWDELKKMVRPSRPLRPSGLSAETRALRHEMAFIKRELHNIRKQIPSIIRNHAPEHVPSTSPPNHPQSFATYVTKPEQASALIQRLHQLMDNKKGKKAIIYLVGAKKMGLLNDKPVHSVCVGEFPMIGKISNYNTSFNFDFTDEELAPIYLALEDLMSK